MLGWLVSTAGALLLALVFARLARAHPAAGGPYAYTREGFGDLAGFLVAWGYWISVWATNAALAVACVGYLKPFIPTVVDTPWQAAALAVALVWSLTALNAIGVKAAGRLQVLTTILKILPLVFIGIAGCMAFSAPHFAIVDRSPSGLGQGILATTTLTLWAFLGLECATIPAGAVQNPERTIPRATIVGTYRGGRHLHRQHDWGDEPRAARSAREHDGAVCRWGTDRVWWLGGGPGCAGRGHLVPRSVEWLDFDGWRVAIGRRGRRAVSTGVREAVLARDPNQGMVIAAVLATALVASNYTRGLVPLFTFTILLATLSTLVPYAFCALASLRRERRGSAASFIAALALIYSAFAIVGAGFEVLFWGLVLMTAGLIVWGTGLFSTKTGVSGTGL